MDRFKYVDSEEEECYTCLVCGDDSMHEQDVYWQEDGVEDYIFCSYKCLREHIVNNIDDYICYIVDRIGG